MSLYNIEVHTTADVLCTSTCSYHITIVDCFSSEVKQARALLMFKAKVLSGLTRQGQSHDQEEEANNLPI